MHNRQNDQTASVISCIGSHRTESLRSPPFPFRRICPLNTLYSFQSIQYIIPGFSGV